MGFAKKWRPRERDRIRMITDHKQVGTLITNSGPKEDRLWYVEFDAGSPRSRWVHESDIEPEKRLVVECSCGVEHLTPMNYYVTVRDGDNANRMGLLAGPFKTHDEALAMVEPASKAAIDNNAWNHFHSYGTSGLPLTHATPGLFNAKLGLGVPDHRNQPETQPPARSLQKPPKARKGGVT